MTCLIVSMPGWDEPRRFENQISEPGCIVTALGETSRTCMAGSHGEVQQVPTSLTVTDARSSCVRVLSCACVRKGKKTSSNYFLVCAKLVECSYCRGGTFVTSQSKQSSTGLRRPRVLSQRMYSVHGTPASPICAATITAGGVFFSC